MPKTGKKHQLVFIGPAGELKRLVKPDVVVVLTCPNKRDNCSLYCAALGMVERRQAPCFGLVCYAMPEPLPIGFLDIETADIDIINSLKIGSDLMETELAK